MKKLEKHLGMRFGVREREREFREVKGWFC